MCKSIFYFLLAVVAFAASAGAQQKAAPLFALSSSASKDNGILPEKYAADPAVCGGKNLTPPLKWSNAPAGTKSFAILMTDPDSRRGAGSVHWVAYNIPAATTSVPEGAGSVDTNGITSGKNSRDTLLYAGPCAPHEDPYHHYLIQVIALDLPPGSLAAGLNRDAFIKAIDGHGLALASLVVRFHRSR